MNCDWVLMMKPSTDFDSDRDLDVALFHHMVVDEG